MKQALFFALTILFALPILNSAIINVPRDQPSIQAAIDAAADGDTITVDAGTYMECIDFGSKSITVTGLGGAAGTVIDGGAPVPRSPVVTITGPLTGSGMATISNFTIRNGTGLNAGNGEGTCGGGIYCNLVSVTIDNNIIENNTTTSINLQQANGGGIYCFDCANGNSVMISNNTVVNNYADTFGGGIYCRDTEGTIIGNIINSNEAHQSGGGVCLGNNCNDVSAWFNEIGYNIAGDDGGGILVKYSDPLIEYNAIIYNATTGTWDPPWGGGGGIFVEGIPNFPASPTIRRNEIIGNTGHQTGGGIRTFLDGTPVIDANYIEANTALLHGGGGIFCGGDNSNAVITNNIINNNLSAVFGGGVYLGNCGDSSNPVSLKNNVISGNTTTTFHGGGIYHRDSWAEIVNNTVASNTAVSGDGGGLYVDGTGAPWCVVNCIFWGNIDQTVPFTHEIHPSTLNVTYSDVMGGYAGTGNIDANPQFFDTVRVDYHIVNDSPCKDSGDNSAAILDVDFEHHAVPDPRLCDGTVDMGADEFNHAHLYFEVDSTVPGLANVVPGAPIHIRVTGLPDSSLGVTLYVGSMLPTPINWGAMGIQYVTATNPVFIGTMPSNPQGGILSTTVTVPTWWQPGSQHFAQALVGPWNGPSSTLTVNHITLLP